MRRHGIICLGMAVTAMLGASARAQEGSDFADLEARVKRLESSLGPNEATPPPKGRLDALYKNDFLLATEDGSFQLKIRGNVHFDTKVYGGNSENPFHFDLRRARIDLQGTLYEYITFRVQPELADNPYIRNAWVDFGFRKWLHLRAGQMKPPFSTSWWTTDNNVNFLERGANTPIYPYFDRGWWLWGDVIDGAVTWNLGAFTGAGMDLDAKKGDIDDHKDIVARFFMNPFKDAEGSGLENLYLVLEGTMGSQSIPTARFETGGYGAAIRDDKFWSWETENPGNGTIDRRDRLGVEMHYLLGPFALSSEYLAAKYRNIDVLAPDGTKVLSEDGSVVSWSTWVSWFLTGERKQVSNFGWKQPAPLENFDPVHMTGIGAWEVLARFTNTRTSESLFDTVSYAGANYRILRGADDVNEVTLGLSWTWNPMVRWMLNYVHLNGNGMRTGSGDNEDMLGLRMIFKF